MSNAIYQEKSYQHRQSSAGFFMMGAYLILGVAATIYLLVFQHPVTHWVVEQIADDGGEYMFSALVGATFVIVLLILSPLLVIGLVLSNR